MVGANSFRAGSGAAVSAPEDGFTASDLDALGQLRTRALLWRRWARIDFVQSGGLDCLAAWETDAAAPSLAVIRFHRTGTYALALGSTVMLTARNLAQVLPAVSSFMLRAAEAPAAG
jgi:hypothetical protein